jgi:glucosamine--fructose-6-phosphate aminotransferase (isomerizing)
MCGIVGYVGSKHIDSVLLVGLERLEYRGYDSAGIASILDGELLIRKRQGKLRILDQSLRLNPLGGTTGIGHTRWATHGDPSERNAHPHADCNSKIAVVHNGIIENYVEIRNRLQQEGHVIASDTDTEVIPHLIEKHFNGDLKEAVAAALKEVEGAYALAVIAESCPDTMVVAKQGSPLVIGLGNGENFIASDIPAILPHTKNVVYLKDGQIATINRDSIKVWTLEGDEVTPEIKRIEWEADLLDKAGYDYYMLKEIHEQPSILEATLDKRLSPTGEVVFENIGLAKQEFADLGRIIIQACGTSWHAGLVGKLLLEEHVRLHTEADISSEFRYRNPVMGGDTLIVAISQSGETADTLESLRSAKSKFLKVLSLCNATGSSIARESDGVIYIQAGPEIGVASTKAFTAQLLALALLTIYLGGVKWTVSQEQREEMIGELRALPPKMRSILSRADEIESLAEKYAKAQNFMFLGRGYNYPIALEGALKLKEISYIHATGYPAGEFKHGPIALVDDETPTVCIATQGPVYPKMVSNICEVKARKGKVIAVATEGDQEIREYADDVIYVPPCSDRFSPMLTVIPLQLLAYSIAVKRGCDVDKPRNLAKSVTVE